MIKPTGLCHLEKLFQNSIGEALMKIAMKNVFPGSLKPSRQCSCCPTNTEIYIVCQVHAPDLDVVPASLPTYDFNINAPCIQDFWHLSSLTQGKDNHKSQVHCWDVFTTNEISLNYHIILRMPFKSQEMKKMDGWIR